MTLKKKFAVMSSETKYVQDFQSVYKRLFLYTLTKKKER